MGILTTTQLVVASIAVFIILATYSRYMRFKGQNYRIIRTSDGYAPLRKVFGLFWISYEATYAGGVRTFFSYIEAEKFLDDQLKVSRRKKAGGQRW